MQILIAGAGIVSNILAHGLTQLGVDVLVVGESPAFAGMTTFNDPRVFGLSPRTQAFLSRLGLWPSGATAIQEIHCSVQGGWHQWRTKASQMGLPNLAYAIPAEVLWSHFKGQAVAHPHQSGMVSTWVREGEGYRVILNTGESLFAQRLIIATGGSSWWKNEHCERIHIEQTDYAQSALLGRFKGSVPLPVVIERFISGGAIACLPVDDQGEYAWIWMGSPEVLQTFPSGSPLEQRARLSELLKSRLGDLSEVCIQGIFPLKGHHLSHAAMDSCAWMGNAVANLHPFGAQGLNVSLMGVEHFLSSLKRTGDLCKAFEEYGQYYDVYIKPKVAIFQRSMRYLSAPLLLKRSALWALSTCPPSWISQPLRAWIAHEY